MKLVAHRDKECARGEGGVESIHAQHLPPSAEFPVCWPNACHDRPGASASGWSLRHGASGQQCWQCVEEVYRLNAVCAVALDGRGSASQAFGWLMLPFAQKQRWRFCGTFKGNTAAVGHPYSLTDATKIGISRAVLSGLETCASSAQRLVALSEFKECQ
eukprot:6171989-Pleurochrysis_carterae.AAC.1